MPNLINKQTGQPENVDYDQLGTAFQAGTHELPTGSSLPLKDENGNLVSVPAEQVSNSLGNGLSFPSTQDVTKHNESIQYGEGVGNVAKATAAGALRGVSAGTSDYALQAMGMSKKDLAKLKEYNPIASTAGEIGGIGASLLAGGVGAPGLISEAGGATAAGVSGLMNAGPEASLASRIMAKVVPKAAGSAVEGALYGTGNVVSESALGDPHLVAQHALTQIGESAMFGAGLGTLLPNPYKSDIAETLGNLRTGGDAITGSSADAAPASMQDILLDSSLSDTQKRGYFQKMSGLKDNADEIKSAAGTLGVPAFEEQLAADKGIQSFGRDLRASPTTVGINRAKAVDGALDSVENQVGEIITPGTPAMTDHELGQNLQQSMTDKFNAEYEPLKPIYDELQQNGKAVTLEPKDTETASKNLYKSDAIKLSPTSDQASFLSSAARDIGNLKTLDQIKAYGTLIAKETIGKPNLRYAASLVRNELDGLENKTVEGLATQLEGDPNFPPDLVEQLRNLPAQKALVDEKYSGLMNKMEEIAGAAGKSKTYGPTHILNFLNDLNPTKLANRLFTKKDPDFLQFMQETFPDELKSMVDSQKSKIVEKTLFDGRIDPSKVLKEVNKFSPEVQKVMFQPGELEKLQAASTYLEAFGKGGTRVTPASSVLSGINFLRHPIKGTIGHVADWAGLTAIQKAIGGPETRTVGALMAIENMATKSAKAIASGAKALVNTAEPFSTASAAKVLASNQDQKDQYDDIISKLAKIKQGPDGLLGHVTNLTENLHDHAPQTSSAMQQTVVRANQYMDSIVPQKQGGPLDMPYQPNKQEMAHVIDAYQGIVNPTSLLKDMKSGILNQNKLLATTNVHPELLNSMRQNIMNSLSTKGLDKSQSMPYQNKMLLGKFLGTALTTKGSNIMQLQSTFNTPQPPPSPNSIGKGGRKGSLTKASISESYLTNAQKMSTGLK